VIVLTAYATVETAKEAIRYGAYDYLTKPFDNANLRKIVRAALAGRRTTPAAGRRCAYRSGDLFVRRDRRAKRGDAGVFELIDRVAPTDANVMILGRAARERAGGGRPPRRSPRKEFPFVPINCAAIPRTSSRASCSAYARCLHRAVQTKKGLFEAAHRGPSSSTRWGASPADAEQAAARPPGAIVPAGRRERGPLHRHRILCASKRTCSARWSRGDSGTTSTSAST